jgi:hypothetical protein
MTNAAESYLNGGGNATITLAVGVDSNGNLINNIYNVWITSFSTSVQTQFANVQTQSQMVWTPIRRSEMMVMFSIDWPLQTGGNTTKGKYDYNGFQAMQQFHNDIRKHQQLSATTSASPPPLSFVYSNNYNGSNSLVDNNLSGGTNTSLSLQPISYQGWILQVTKEYDRFKAVYSNQYVMNVLTPSSDNSGIPSSIVVSGSISQLLPTSSTVLQQGANWSSANISMRNGINIDGIPG